jgi:hypothetical protein
MSETLPTENHDIVLIGGGIMSATLGTLLKELDPALSIVMLEALHDCAQESSDGWNNAGTGHAANCELNYTPQRDDGSIDISKALEVNTEFDISRQLWAYLVGRGAIPDPRAFLHPCPHMSFVWGEENVAFLRARYKAMSAHHCYHGMEYSEDAAVIAQWAPLVIEGRDSQQPIAATRMITGTDVDYGALTHLLVKHLTAQPGFAVHYNSKVEGLERQDDQRWRVRAEDTRSGAKRHLTARCRCCKNRKSRKPGATGASRSAASGCAATSTRSASATTPRCTARPPAVRRRCRCRTWTPASSAASSRCCSDRMPASPPSCSSMAACRTCSPRSRTAISFRCWTWPATTCN